MGESKPWWQSFGGEIINAGAGLWGQQLNAEAQATTAQANANAIAGIVKVFAIIAGVITVIGFLFKRLK